MGLWVPLPHAGSGTTWLRPWLHKCCAGRDLAPVRARILSLGNKGEAVQGAAAVRLCCLSVFEQGSNASGIRYLLRRIERQMPEAAVVVCLWHAAGTSAMLAALRSEGTEETIVFSIGELVALARAISARRVASVRQIA